MKILIVDDKKENLYLLETLLKKHGHEVLSAANGEEALERIHVEGCDMIISDILMPIMDGFRLCQEVKKTEGAQHIPFVFYTATYTDEKDEAFALKAGADMFIRKPMDPDEFMKRIQSIIKQAEKGKISGRRPVLEEEKKDLKLYSERLVNKLEKKMMALEKEITERKRAEEELCRERDFINTFLKSSPAFFVAINSEGKTLMMNQALLDVLGYTVDEVIGTDYLTTFVPAADREILANVFEQLTEVHQTTLNENNILTRDGQELLVEWHGAPILTKNGEFDYFFGVGIDISDRKQAEQALQWESEFNAAVAALSSKLMAEEPIEEISYLVLQYAQNLTGSQFGFVGYIDPNTGYLVCPTLTRDIWDICDVEEKDIVFKEFRGLWGWVLNNRKPLMTNAPGDDPRTSGTPAGHVPIQRFLSAPALIGDELVGQVGLANSDQDYTERDLKVAEGLAGLYAIAIHRKRGENELREYRDHLEEMVKDRTRELEQKAAELEKANLRLQEADRLKSVFLASMSHELRTPLNSIIGFTGIILQGMVGKINEEQEKQLLIVKKSADHLLSLINDLLDVAKIEARRVEPSVEAFALEDVVKEIMETFSPLAIEKGLELRKDAPKGTMLVSDRRRIKQILMNIVGNAVKFTDQGSIRVVAMISDNRYLKMSVTDTGIGIREENLDKLFKPFQQIENSLAKRHEGTGLGLYITKKLLDLLGGNISATSEFGKGSEFILSLPITPKGQDQWH